MTDGERTFWHWQSTFDDAARPRARAAPTWSARERLRGAASRACARHLRRRRPAPARGARPSAVPRPATAAGAGASSSRAYGGPEVLRHQAARGARRPAPGEVRIRQRAIGVNYIDVYLRTRLDAAAADAARACPAWRRPAAWSTSGAGVARPAARRPRRLCLPAARRLLRRAHDAGRRRWCVLPDAIGRRDGGRAAC